jgi:hypothetical protein
MAGIEQEFPISLWAEDRTFDNPHDNPTRLRRDPGGGALAHLAVDRRVAHHPTFADTLSAGLELRLDERDERGLFGRERERRRQYRREPDEARITGDYFDGLGDLGSGQVTGVQALVNDDARILPQFPGELTMPDIDGVDPRAAARQQHIGEAASRGADIEGRLTIEVDPKMVQGVSELDPAARNPGMVVSRDGERRIHCKLLARLADAPSGAADNPGEDQSLRLSPAVGHAKVDEKLIGPPLCGF